MSPFPSNIPVGCTGTLAPLETQIVSKKGSPSCKRGLELVISVRSRPHSIRSSVLFHVDPLRREAMHVRPL